MGRGAVVLGGDVRDGVESSGAPDANDQVEGPAGLDEGGERVRNRGAPAASLRFQASAAPRGCLSQ